MSLVEEVGRAHQYPSTEDWLKARRRGIGSSDAPAILGLTPWRSPLQVYHEKRNTLPDEIGPKYVEMAKWGLLLEDVIAQRYALETNREVIKPPAHSIVTHETLPFMLATVDRYAWLPIDAAIAGQRVRTKIVLELKNAHWMSRDKWEGTDDEDTDKPGGSAYAEPPLDYVVQVQHQMAITGAPFASIAVLIGGTEFRWADVKRDDDFIRGLLAKEEEFWNYHVLRGIEPPADGSEATKTLLRKLHPADTGAVTELPVEAMQWADQLAIAKSTITEAEADKLLAENRLKQAIGDASIGTLRDGRAFSYKQQTRKAHQVAESTFRVLRPIKAGAR